MYYIILNLKRIYKEYKFCNDKSGLKFLFREDFGPDFLDVLVWYGRFL